MTGDGENGEQPILNVEGDLVALGPLRRDLLPLYTRWINDLGVQPHLPPRLHHGRLGSGVRGL